MQNILGFEIEKPCECCRQIILDFENLLKENEEKIRQLIRSGKPVTAISELRNITRSSLKDVKLWVEHSGELADRKTIPCPYFGELLRTSQAKQCRVCLRAWHDENEIKWLK